MINKLTRLSRALWIESVKRLPYIGFILVLLILAQVYVTGHQVAENVKISRQNTDSTNTLVKKQTELTEEVKKLSQDNKSLSEQNNRLADQNNRYEDCIAQLFAKYTRDGKPVYILDLNTCAAQYTTNGIATSITTPKTTTPNISTQQSQTTPSKPGNSTPSTPKNRPIPGLLRLLNLNGIFRSLGL